MYRLSAVAVFSKYARTFIGVALLVGLIVFFALQRATLVQQHGGATFVSSLDTPLHTLKLAWYREVALIDPIYALEGTDPTSLSNAIEDLREFQEKIAALYPNENRSALMRAVPFSYLESLAWTEAARQEFLNNPSLLNALAYHRSFSRTSKRYIEDANKYLAVIKEHPLETNVMLADGEISTESIVRGMNIALVDAEIKRSESGLRLRCLIYFNDACPSIEKLNYARLADLERSLPQETEATASQLQESLHILSALKDFQPSDSPIVSLPSPCAQNAKDTFLTWYMQLENGKARKHTSVQDILIHDLELQKTAAVAGTRPPRADDNLVEWFTEQGVRYLFQPTGNLYRCASAIETERMISGAQAVQRYIQTKQSLSTEGLRSDELAQLEQRLMNADTISAHDVHAYILQLARMRTLSKLPGAAEGIEHVDRLIAEFRGGTTKFDELLRATTADNAYIELITRHDAQMHLPLLLVTRSFPWLTFRTSDPSFVSANIEFTLPSEQKSEDANIVRFSELLARGMSKDALAQDLFEGFSVMSSALQGTH